MPPKATRQSSRPLGNFGAFVQSTMQTWHVPGLSIAVVKDGETIFLQGFGNRDVENKQPVTPNTLFALASGTKAFTTLALGILADEGRLDWDTPVRHYLPTFKLFDGWASERMTSRDLVSHRSGLPRHELAWYNAPHKRADLMRRLQYLEPNRDLRTLWQYQNLMYMAAGYLIEHLTGETWEEFVQHHIFGPLEMHGSNTTIAVSEATPDHALPYEEKKDELRRVPFYTQFAAGPAGAINTTASDMSKWLLLHLAGGTYPAGRLIAASQLRDMHAPQMVIQRATKYSELPHASYGLGWFIEPYRGYDLVHHGGNIDGFSTMTTFMPRENLGVVVLCNLAATQLPWILCLNVYERLLGLEQTPWSDRFQLERTQQKAAAEQGRQKSVADRVPNTGPSHPLEAYVGDYDHPGYGILSVSHVDDRLQATLNGTTFPVAHYHYDTFELYWEHWDLRLKATFAANGYGDITSVTVPFEPTVRDICFTRLPDRSMSGHNVLSRFAGEYDLLGQSISIVIKNDTTLLARLPVGPEVELVYRRGTEWRSKDLSTVTVEFSLDPDGTVAAVILSNLSGTFKAPRRPN
ncbi:MAG: serine hydrolase [Herpetosiphon sp.]